MKKVISIILACIIISTTFNIWAETKDIENVEPIVVENDQSISPEMLEPVLDKPQNPVEDDLSKEVENETSEVPQIAPIEEREIAIDEIHFPDQQFRDFVKGQFDTNRNNYLSFYERTMGFSVINVYKLGIYSLKGIEYFPDITGLKCADNFIDNLDLSKNTKLDTISCGGNNFQSLDVSMLSNLTGLNCKESILKEVKLPASIISLDLSNTQIETLDVSHCLQLNYFTMSDVPTLQYLNVSNLLYIETFKCERTGLLSLDLSNTQIRWCYIANNQKLSKLILGNQPRLERLWGDGCALPSLDLSGCTILNLNSIIINNQKRSQETLATINLEEFYIDLGKQIDFSKVSSVSTGRYDSTNGRIYFDDIPGETMITYKYDVGLGKKMQVSMPIYNPFHKLTLHIPGQDSETIIVDENGNYKIPNPSKKEGEVFIGWYFDDTYTNPYQNEILMEDSTLYAKYSKLYNVTFINGTNQTKIEVIDNNLVVQPEAPSKQGYQFLGWYLSNNVQWDFSTPITENLTLTAYFKKDIVVSDSNNKQPET